MYLICPARREKKKTVAGQVTLCAHNGFSEYCGGFEEIQGRRSFVPFEGMTTIR
ncbi:hypothetical protein [Blautia sp. An81]|uniref:hypothetical protein n=1 Tax=Blautia sp. An81 TaxID=1965659 RepID=UPI0013043830|nr:hypothetical protein [Blautia sp. An81]